MHQTTCRGPSYGNTQQEPDWSTLRSKVKVKYAKKRFLNTGYRIAPLFTDRIVSKCTRRRAVFPAMGTLNKNLIKRILRSKFKVKYAKTRFLNTGYRIAPSFTGRIVSKCTRRRAVVPAMGTPNKNLIGTYYSQSSRSIMRKITFFHTLSRAVCRFTIQIGSKHEYFLSQDPSSV